MGLTAGVTVVLLFIVGFYYLQKWVENSQQQQLHEEFAMDDFCYVDLTSVRDLETGEILEEEQQATIRPVFFGPIQVTEL